MFCSRLNDSIVCAACGALKEFNQFYIDESRSDNDRIWIKGKRCKKCISKASAAARIRIYGSNGLSRKYHRYKITKDHINEMIKYYNGLCPICLKRKVEVIDHDHESNRVRGMLCNICNQALGMIGDDNDIPNRLLKYFTDSTILTIVSKLPKLGQFITDKTKSPGEQTLRLLYDNGLSYADIATKYNVSLGTVAYWFRKYKITARTNSDGVRIAWDKGKFDAISQ